MFPSEAQCTQCHTSAANFALGPETAQLNRDFQYPSTGRTANQLETIDHVMMFSSPLSGAASTLPAFVSPADITQSLDQRARAYLHTNCSSCHRPNGPTPTDLDLRHDTALNDTRACLATPQAGNLGIGNARIIDPGSSATSVLLARMNTRDANAMPPLGSTMVDVDGVQLVRDWIDSLSGCN